MAKGNMNSKKPNRNKLSKRENILEDEIENIEKVKGEIGKWIDNDLAKSGLTRKDIDIKLVLPRKGRQQHNGGYDIIFREPGSGEEMMGVNNKAFRRTRYRPPLPKDKHGKEQRYSSQFRAGNRCYIPIGVHDRLMKDSSAPLFLTEGEKKAAKAVKEGLPAIGLIGIWGWLESKSKRDEKGEDYAIHPDIAQYLKQSRNVYLIYDSDSKDTPEKAGNFRANAERLAFEIVKLNCKLQRVDLPASDDGRKQGLDDYLVKHSVDELRNYINTFSEEVTPGNMSERRDPYHKLKEEEGRPYLIKYTRDGMVSNVMFNQSWNAGFISQNIKLVFEPMEGEFYFYEEKNGLWKYISDDLLKSMLSHDLGEYWREFHRDKASELLPRRTDRMLSESINLLRGLVEKMDVFRKKAGNHVIHMANGMLHVKNMTLRNFSSDYYSRNQIPFALDEKAECPHFIEDLLYSALPEDDVDLIQRWAGTVLLGGNPTQQFMILDGTSGGGKGTFAEIMETVTGQQNVAELRTHFLAERFEFAAFVGKSLLCGKDVPANFLQIRGAESIKKLVGHDYLQAEHKRSNKRSSLYGDFGMLITSNNRLKVKLEGDTEAWRRRIMLIRYDRPPAKRRVANFAKNLIESEGKGILLWMIAGAVKAMNEIDTHGRLLLNERQQNLVDSLLYESDSIRRFISDCLEASQGWDLSTEELKTAYVQYCEKNNWSFQSSREIERQLPDLLMRDFSVHCSHGLKRDGKSVRGYPGIRLKNK